MRGKGEICLQNYALNEDTFMTLKRSIYKGHGCGKTFVDEIFLTM